MNQTRILLTSFQTWLSHQESNSSDDLLAEIQKLDYFKSVDLFFLRNLPVDIELASQEVIKEINKINPKVLICCGMAEKRNKLTIESTAYCQDRCLHTSTNLNELIKLLIFTEISCDAGKFVCEGLYYRLLKYIQEQDKKIQCIFVHVPLIQGEKLNYILRDFHLIFSFFTKTFDYYKK